MCISKPVIFAMKAVKLHCHLIMFSVFQNEIWIFFSILGVVSRKLLKLLAFCTTKPFNILELSVWVLFTSSSEACIDEPLSVLLNGFPRQWLFKAGNTARRKPFLWQPSSYASLSRMRICRDWGQININFAKRGCMRELFYFQTCWFSVKS